MKITTSLPAIAVTAKVAVGKAVTVQFEAHRFRTVTRLLLTGHTRATSKICSLKSYFSTKKINFLTSSISVSPSSRNSVHSSSNLALTGAEKRTFLLLKRSKPQEISLLNFPFRISFCCRRSECSRG